MSDTEQLPATQPSAQESAQQSAQESAPGSAQSSAPMESTTPWTRSLLGRLRALITADSGSAGLLVGAVVAALAWANIAPASYEKVWHTTFAVDLGSSGLDLDVRTWINSGLMTFFFLVVGLEARREFDLGDLRDRRRALLPLTVGLAGMAVPVAIYLAVTAGDAGMHGWGVAMSTDTALALGLLTVVARRLPSRMRTFLVTLFVVDDVASLLVIAFVYSAEVRLVPVLVAVAVFLLSVVLNRYRVRVGLVYLVIGVIAWFALMKSGVDPIVLGLAVGLVTTAYSPSRSDLEGASGLYRQFREQPTAELARTAATTLSRTVSGNARLENLFLPWVSYLIVPLFALANAGIVINQDFLSSAVRSPVTIGIVLGYVLGKPFAVVVGTYLVDRFTHGRVRPQVGWAAVAGGGTIAGIGFTVSFVVASLAFDHRPDLRAEAQFGVLCAGVLSTLLTWLVFRVTARLPLPLRARALIGDDDEIIDLVDDVDPDRDHIRGAADATVTIVEYGDFECPYCGQAEPAVRSELNTDADLRYVWRHLPLHDVHPRAQLAAEAAEAAACQGKFWEYHDLLLQHQDKLKIVDLLKYADQLGLDTDRVHNDLIERSHERRVDEDIESADRSGVSGTPTFFINGRRHYGAYDAQSLAKAVKTARVRAKLQAADQRSGSTTGSVASQ